jgi:hypothetical protein
MISLGLLNSHDMPSMIYGRTVQHITAGGIVPGKRSVLPAHEHFFENECCFLSEQQRNTALYGRTRVHTNSGKK